MKSIVKKETKLKEIFLNHLSNNDICGNISLACLKSNISRQTFYYWKKHDLTFRSQAEAFINDGHENLADLAENQLKKKILNGDTTAIIFALKSLRRQNYGEAKLNTIQQNQQPQEIYTTRQKELMIKLSALRDYYLLNKEIDVKEEEKKVFLNIMQKIYNNKLQLH